MLVSTDLYGDLLYLQERHEISSLVIDGLIDSSRSARICIKQYKIKMLSISMLFAMLGGTFVVIALHYHEQLIGLLAGMIGSVVMVYAFSVLKKMKLAISAIEKIAKYHELL